MSGTRPPYSPPSSSDRPSRFHEDIPRTPRKQQNPAGTSNYREPPSTPGIQHGSDFHCAGKEAAEGSDYTDKTAKFTVSQVLDHPPVVDKYVIRISGKKFATTGGRFSKCNEPANLREEFQKFPELTTHGKVKECSVILKEAVIARFYVPVQLRYFIATVKPDGYVEMEFRKVKDNKHRWSIMD